MKHTPGPWETNLLYSMVQCEDIEICTIGVNPGNEDFGYQQYSANAKLIAAAPDMLEALIVAIRVLKVLLPEAVETTKIIESAIKKATEI